MLKVHLSRINMDSIQIVEVVVSFSHYKIAKESCCQDHFQAILGLSALSGYLVARMDQLRSRPGNVALYLPPPIANLISQSGILFFCIFKAIHFL